MINSGTGERTRTVSIHCIIIITISMILYYVVCTFNKEENMCLIVLETVTVSRSYILDYKWNQYKISLTYMIFVALSCLILTTSHSYIH